MNLQTFYQENQYLILCLLWAVIFILGFAAHLAWQQMRNIKPDDNNEGGIPRYDNPPPPPRVTHDDDFFISKFYNEKWILIGQIKEAQSIDRLHELYPAIDAFERYWDLLVNHTTVFVHTQKIYEAHAAKALELTKEAPVSTGS
jgi:hypothetical protein